MLSYILPAFLCLTSINAQTLPPAFFLAGDSTTAPNGGWGDAFLATLTNGAIGTNFAATAGQTTTTSFRSDGHWEKLLNAVAHTTASYTPLRNPPIRAQRPKDRRRTRGVCRQPRRHGQGHAQCRRPVDLFLAALSRRNYENGDVVQDLGDIRNATIQAAAEAEALWADLNDRSCHYLSGIREENAMTFNLADDDHTRLNGAGAMLFAGMVGVLLEEKVSAGFREYIVVEEGLAAALEAGEYYYPT